MMMRYPHKRGFLFLTAIIILAVMMIIGVTFLGSSFHQLHEARQAHNALHALVMADAGVNYAIWYQKHSSSPIPVTDARFLDASTLIRSLDLGGTITPAFTGSFDNNQDEFSVWLVKYARTTTDGKTIKGYQAVSRGYYRRGQNGNYHRTVRAVLQPPPEAEPTTVIDFPQLDFVIYTESDLSIATSTNVHASSGRGLGTNGSAYLSTSNGGSIDGSVYSAGAIIFDKNKTSVTGNVTYGTKILDPKGKDITSSASSYVGGSVSSGATTMLLPEMNSDNYLAWAFANGLFSFFTGTRLTNADSVNNEILYANPYKTPGYVLSIDTHIKKSGLLFVNGDVVINGNIQLGVNDTDLSDGDQSKPFVIVATGSVTCKGTPVVNGIIWTKGAFGSGTPTVNGSIISNNIAGFQGNPTLSFRKYSAAVLPPNALDNEHSWRSSSWEELR